MPVVSAAAVIAGIDTGTVTEDANLTAGQLETSGQLTITDPDVGQDHFTAQTNAAGSYGTFNIDQAGHWSYSADNSQSAVQQLKAGATLTDSFTVASADGTAHTVTITLTGTNDAPTLAAQSQSVTEDGAKLTGQMVATDIDTGDTQAFSTTAQIAGFALGADGSYSFDPSDAAYQHLAAGQTQTLTIPVTVTDSAGATATQNLVITLTGSNDGAVISGTDASAVTEDTQLTTAGKLTVSDVDDNEASFTAQANTAGSYGSFTLAADGTWTYTLDNTNPAVQALGQNGKLTDSLTVQSVDGTTHQITVTINGHDDGAVIGGIDTGTVTEDANLTAGQLETSGQLTITDPDVGQDHFTAQTNAAGSYGTFNIDQAGHWSYSADNSQSVVQQLKAGATLTDSFTVASADGTTHTVTVTLTGTNDAPTLAAQSQSVTEDGAKLTGQMVATDIDTGDTQAFSTTAQIAGFTLNADGSYSFDPSDAAYQHLAAGQTQTLTIPVTVTDSAGATATQNLVITLTGSNDAPHVTGAQFGVVVEDGSALASVPQQVMDFGPNRDGAVMPIGALKTSDMTAFSLEFTVMSDGRAINSSHHGETYISYATSNHNNEFYVWRPDNLTISIGNHEHPTGIDIDDGRSHRVSIIWSAATGSLDVLVDGVVRHHADGYQQGYVMMGGGALVLGQDIDHYAPQTGSTPWDKYGFDLDDAFHGQLGYATMANQAVDPKTLGGGTLAQLLAHNPSLFLDIRPDGNGQILDTTGNHQLLTHTGVSVASVMADGGVVTNLGQQQVDGQLVVQDKDSGQSGLVAQPPLQGTYGVFQMDASGHWHYTLDNTRPAVQSLVEGEQVSDRFEVFTTDGTKVPVIITVMGRNDVAVIHGADQGRVTEDDGVSSQGMLEATGHLKVRDVDRGESKFVPATGLSSAQGLGHLSIDANGGWHYSVDNSLSAIQALQAGQHINERFTVHSIDGTTHEIVLTINGHDDGAVIGGIDTGTVTEDANLMAGLLETSGQLTITDPDVGQDHFTAQTNAAGSYGTFNIDQAGHWSYSADNSQNAVQQLKAGATLTDSFTVASADGTTHTVTVTLTGTNDAPTLTAQSQSVTEDGAKLTGQMVATDIDTGDTQAFSTTAQIAGFTLNADGSYSFDPSDAAYQHLAAGQTQTLTIPVTVTDSAGATATQNLVITLTGSNDGAVISGADTGTVTEDIRFKASGQLKITDPDDQESAFTAQAHTAGHYGSFTLAADGSWIYTLDNRNSAVNALQHGSSLTDSFTATSVDGTTHTVTVTIAGTNDDPVLLLRSHAVAEDGSRITGNALVSDPDTGDTAVYSTTAQIAGFTLGADGSYSFDPSDAAYQHLAQGQKLTLSIPITVTDSQGAHSTQPLLITLTGSNDGAVISGTDSGTVTEDIRFKASGQLQITDPDDQESAFTAQAHTAGHYGSFTLAADGSWIYTLDNRNSAVNALQHGSSLTDSFTATSVDGTTHTVTVTIAGTNDDPVLLLRSHAVTEDGSRITGNALVSDPDTGDTAVYSSTAQIAGFALGADGSYSFDPSDAAYQHLAQGQKLTLSIPITVTDSQGAHSTQPLLITLTGSNDGAVISGTDASAVTEDTLLTTAGKLTVSDVDDNEASFTAQANTAGSYGSFTLASDGTWTYTLDNTNPAIQALGQNGKLTDSLTVQSVDGTRHTITVTINGSNDAAVITHDGTITVKEDVRVVPDHAHNQDMISASGHLMVSDADTGEAAFSGIQHGAGSRGLGSFTVFPNKVWAYQVDNNLPAVQALREGQSLTESYTLHSADGTQHTITVTIQGTNDAPTLATQSQSVTEDGAKLTGQMVATDVDQGDTPAFSTTAQIAGFTLNADGSYSFDPSDAAYQHLAAGQTQTLTIPVAVTDSAGATATQNLVITLTGSNDGAVISGADTGTVTEDIRFKASGQLKITDPDDQESAFTAQAHTAGHYGSFTLAADGSWIYTLDNRNSAVNALQHGSSLTDSFTATSVDGTTHTVTVTIAGTNDDPVLLLRSHAVAEDGSRITGNALVSDPDSGDTAVYSTTAQFAGFTLNADGSYSFDPSDAAYQHLAQGQKLTLSIPITVTDSQGAHSTQPLLITLTGSNDGAVISGTDTGTVTEDQDVDASHLLGAHGHLQIIDADAGQAAFQPLQDLAGHYGHLSLDKDGAWVYHADNNSAAVQALAKGQTVTDSFVVHSFDGTAHTIQVNLQGADEVRSDLMGLVAAKLMDQYSSRYKEIASAITSRNGGAVSSLELTFSSGTPKVVDADGHVLESFITHDYFGTHLPLGHLLDLLKSHPGAQLILDGPVGGSSAFYVNNSGDVMHLNVYGIAIGNIANTPLGSAPIEGLPSPNGAVASGNPAPPAPHVDKQQDEPTAGGDDGIDAAVVGDVNHHALPPASTNGHSGPGSPLADYLHFADTSQHVGLGSAAGGTAVSPLADYLAAAGVAPENAQAYLPPPDHPVEVLHDLVPADVQHDNDTGSAGEHVEVASASHHLPDPLHPDDPQHPTT